MLGSLGEVSYDIISRDKTKTGLDSASAGAKKGEGAVKSMSSTVQKHSFAIGGAMTGAGVAMIASSETINGAYNDIRIGTGATGAALKDLENTFDEVYGSIPASAEDVGGAIAALNTHTGATGPVLEDITTKVLNVSRMMGEDGVKNADLYGQALNQWGLDAEQGTEKMDFMFKVTQDTGIGFGELITQLNTYGPVLQNAGFTTEEAAQLMGELDAAGIKVSRVMPGLNKSFRDWAAEGKDSREELTKIVEEIKNTEDGTVALNLAAETFGAEGAQRLLVAIKQDAFELEDLGITTEDTTGLINETADSTLLLTDKLKMLKDRTAATLAPFEGVGLALTSIGGPLMSLNYMMPIFSAIQSGTLVPSLTAHAIAAWGVIAPYLMIIAPIVAVIAILYILEKKFGVLTKAAEWITEGFGKLVDFVKGIFSGELMSAGDIVGMFGDKILFLLGPIGAVIYAIKNWKEIWTFIKALFDKILSYLAALADKFRAAGKALVQALIDGITSIIGRPADILRGALGSLRAMLPGSDAKEGPLSDLTHSGKALVETFAAGMESADTNVGETFEKNLAAVPVAKGMGGEGGTSYGGDTIMIDNVNLSRDYDFEALMKDIENYQQSKRVQRGINAV